jgi:alpha-L-arabinofuranosidase
MSRFSRTYLETVLSPAPERRTLAASAVRDSGDGSLTIKIVNRADIPAPLRIVLAGVAGKDIRATRTILTGPDADAINEDGQPPAARPPSGDVALKPECD